MNPYKELLEAVVRGERELAPITGLLGMRLVSWNPGMAQIEMQVGPEHHNPLGTVHGGVLCDLADAACGTAVASSVEASQTFTTVDLHMTFFRPVQAAQLLAEARVVRMGRRTCYVECEVRASGQLMAKATSTLMLSDSAQGESR